MPLHPKLEEKLGKTFPPDSRIDDSFRGNDITFVTNNLGEPITLFIGKRGANGSIKGERYVRRIGRENDGTTIRKSHWECKGKS